MKLEPASGIEIDIDDRFRTAVTGFPRVLRLLGNAMQRAVAQRLLEENADHVTVSEEGVPVQCMSLEAYGTRFLETFLEHKEPLQGRLILHTIPEDLLIKYAEHHGIAVVHEEKTPVRRMLERIREEQPQTFFSLARSAERLSEKMGVSPEGDAENS